MGNYRGSSGISFNGTILIIANFFYENCISFRKSKFEKRIAITPEIAKKYTSLGFDVYLSKNYGAHLGITDDEYKKIGAKFSDDEKEIINLANIIVQLRLLSEDKSSIIKR